MMFTRLSCLVYLKDSSLQASVGISILPLEILFPPESKTTIEQLLIYSTDINNINSRGHIKECFPINLFESAPESRWNKW